MVYFRSNGISPFEQFPADADRWFGGFLDRGGMAPPARAYPPVNVWEANDALVIEAELPGLKSEDLDVSVVRNELVIRGKSQPFANEGASCHRCERPSGEFTRVLQLPFEVEAEHVEAKLHDGVLLVTLPRAESAKPRRIEVAQAN